jgi:hypothetical protein
VAGAPSDGFGLAVGAADLDLTGGTGWAVGAPYAGGVGSGAGAVSVLSGVPATAGEAFATISGEASLDAFGTSVLSADFDDDGAVDLLVGAPGADHILPDAGAAYVFFGPLEAGPRSADLSGALFEGGQVSRDPGHAGYSLAEAAGVVDANGDGVADLLLSQGGTDTEHLDAGAVFVLLGPMYRATVTAALFADARLYGARPADFAGDPCLGTGDLTGDGRDDVVVAANGASPERVAVFSGPRTGDLTFDDAVLRIDAARPGDLTGWSLAANDVDEDGVLELLIGAPSGGDGEEGEVRIVRRFAPGVMSAGDLRVIGGRRTADQTGASLAPVGAHGFAIGSPFADDAAGVVSLLEKGWL